VLHTLAKRIGSSVAEARRRARLSQQQLADRLKVSRKHIGQIERGERTPSWPVTVRLAELLGLSLDAIVLSKDKRSHRTHDWFEEAATLLRALPEERRREVLTILRVMATSKRRGKG